MKNNLLQLFNIAEFSLGFFYDKEMKDYKHSALILFKIENKREGK